MVAPRHDDRCDSEQRRQRDDRVGHPAVIRVLVGVARHGCRRAATARQHVGRAGGLAVEVITDVHDHVGVRALDRSGDPGDRPLRGRRARLRGITLLETAAGVAEQRDTLDRGRQRSRDRRRANRRLDGTGRNRSLTHEDRGECRTGAGRSAACRHGDEAIGTGAIHLGGNRERRTARAGRQNRARL